MTNQELSLLLFFETVVVDQWCRFNTAHLNDDDNEIAKRWHDEGYIKSGRIVFEDIKSQKTHWVELSAQAWMDAHAERFARGQRIMKKIDFRRTDESVPLCLDEEVA